MNFISRGWVEERFVEPEPPSFNRKNQNIHSTHSISCVELYKYLCNLYLSWMGCFIHITKEACNIIDRNSDPGRPIDMLLKLYEKPQIGESEDVRQYSKGEQRLFERLDFADYVANELNLNKGPKKRIRHIVMNVKKLKDLHGNCSWETIIVAICFYVKTCYHPNCKITHIERYKICRDHGLTLNIYSIIITRLAHLFETDEFLSPLCPTSIVRNKKDL